MAHRSRSQESADGFRSGNACCLGTKRKSRRAVPRRFSGQGRAVFESEHGYAPGSRWNDGSSAGAIARDAGLSQAGYRGNEVSTVTFKIWRGDAKGGAFE